MYDLSEAAAAELCAAHAYLGGETGDERRPVLPNLIDGNLLVGHQGHALCIGEWAGLVRLAGVINLAPERVDGAPARKAVAAAVEGGVPAVFLEARCPDGEQLTDKPGDGERLLEVLPSVLTSIGEACRAGHVFMHCQQGRSRAGSIATAVLLSRYVAESTPRVERLAALKAPRVVAPRRALPPKPGPNSHSTPGTRSGRSSTRSASLPPGAPRWRSR